MAARSLSLLLSSSNAFSPSDAPRISRPSSFSSLASLLSTTVVSSSLLNPVSLRRSTIQMARYRRRGPSAMVTANSVSPAEKSESVSADNTRTESDSMPTDKSPAQSARMVKSLALGEMESRKLRYLQAGTETFLMGILVEGTSVAASFLRAHGITLFKVRDEIVNLLGKADRFTISPIYLPLTEPAKRALDWAVKEKLKSGKDGEVTTTHLLLGIWAQEDSAGYKILAKLGFDDEKAKELAKFINDDDGVKIR